MQSLKRRPKPLSHRASDCGVLTSVVQAIGELSRFDAQTFREFLDRRKSRLAPATLDPADAGQVDPGGVGQAVLREPFPRAQLTDSLAERLAGAVGVLVNWHRHGGSVAAPDRLDQSITAVNLLA